MILPEIHITQYAVRRAKEVFSWTASELYAKSEKAYFNGNIIASLPGPNQLLAYELFTYNRTVNIIRVYDDVIYYFSDNTLITFLPVEPLKRVTPL